MPWLVVAAVALLWPAHAIGPLDGVPLDSRLEAVAIGLLFPVLCRLHPAFLQSRVARVLVVALFAVKAIGAVGLTQGGWCERLVTPLPLAQDADQTQHSWDARADWRSSVPRCSAVMARSYPDLTSFPVWFLNLTGPAGRPPNTTIAMTVDGFLSAPDAGVLAVGMQDGQQIAGAIDDTPIADVTRGVNVTAGAHRIRLSTVFAGEHWRFIPTWNGADLFTSMSTTMTEPTRVDAILWKPVRLLTAALALALLAAWTIAAAIDLSPGRLASAWTLAMIAIAAVAGAVGVHTAGRGAVVPLVAAALVPLPDRLRNARGALLLVGLPWLALFAGSSLADVGRITLFTPGDDFTHFNRFAYRVYMQGYWLEGGQFTFWFQPLYRWIIGGTHVLFGDSSIGEWYLDAACLLVGAQFAFFVCHRAASFRWGIAASALMLATVAIGPSWWVVGRDLSEITASGFAYTAALLLLGDRPGGLGRAVAAGVLGVLCFYTRLNHVIWMCALTALLVPLDVPAGALWRPREWLPRIRLSSAVAIASALVIGLVLFAWRTWYYTGVFSIFYGTQRDLVATIRPTDTVVQAIGHVIEALLVLVTVQDPPRFDPRAILVVFGVLVAVLALVRVPWFRDVPAAPALFCAAGLAGALVARGTAYVGRFSIHLMPVAVALVACFGAKLFDRFSARQRVRLA